MDTGVSENLKCLLYSDTFLKTEFYSYKVIQKKQHVRKYKHDVIILACFLPV